MKRHVVAPAEQIPPGSSKVLTVGGKDIWVFNMEGAFYALANRCPHEGAELCKGRIVGLVQSSGVRDYRIEREGEFIRCPWHGWEFDIRTGQSWCDPKRTRIRRFEVSVEDGAELAKGPYVAETFEVEIEEDYVILLM